MHLTRSLLGATLHNGLALALGLGCGIARAGSAVVSCVDDNSADSLRSLLANPGNGAVISVAACSTISVTQGEIPIPASVTLQGPANGTTSIVGNHNGRVFRSTSLDPSSNALTLLNVSVSGGSLQLPSGATDGGGCIASGTVTLQNSVVTDCQTSGDTYPEGGAIHATAVYLRNSRVTASAVNATGSGSAFGGGVFADSALQCTGSTISGNTSLAAAATHGEGGALVVNGGSISLDGCTIDSNSAQYAAGVLQFGSGATVTVSNSTISGNRASGADGGLFSEGTLTIQNSTIAFNRADVSCAGVRSRGAVTLQSSILADNRTPDAACVDLFAYASVSGANNLIVAASPGAPADTLSDDPELTPLADRGGATRTHGLSSRSPALDRGNNAAMLAADQRGLTRSVGAGADIGAFERQAGDDEIYYGGFD